MFSNRTRDEFKWNVEYYLGFFIETNLRHHPKLAAEFLGVFLEEDIQGPVDTVDDESINENSIADATDSNSDIVHNSGFCNNNRIPTPFLTPINNPTPDYNYDK